MIAQPRAAKFSFVSRLHSTVLALGIALLCTAHEPGYAQQLIVIEKDTPLGLEELRRATINKLSMVKKLRSYGHEGNKRFNSFRAEVMLNEADEAFAKEKYVHAVANYQHYLKVNQMPAPGVYLHIQFKLANAYTRLSQPKSALLACTQYISAYINAPSERQDELLACLKLAVSISPIRLKAYRPELKKFLSSLVSLQLDPSHKAEVLYFAALAAARAGMHDYAGTWLKKAVEGLDTKTFKARALYFLGLLNASLAKYAEAEALFKRVLIQLPKTEALPAAADLAAYTQLSLARVLSLQAKSGLSLLAYDQVPASSALSMSARYEEIFVYFQLADFKRARALLANFLASYPEAREASYLRAHLPYFDMRAGSRDLAKQGIEARNLELGALANTLSQWQRPEVELNEEHLQLIAAQVSGLTPDSPVLRRLLKLCTKLYDMHTALRENDQKLDRMVALLSRAEPRQLFPELYASKEAYINHGFNALALGEALREAELTLYASELTPKDATLISELTRRSKSLQSSTKRYYASLEAIKEEPYFMRLGNQIAQRQEKLERIRAGLNASSYLSTQSGSLGVEGREAKLAKLAFELDEQQEAIVGMSERMRFKRLASKKAEFLALESQGRLTRRAALLTEALDIFANYQEEARAGSDEIDLRLVQATKHGWDELMKEIYDELVSVDASFTKEFDALFARLEVFASSKLSLLARIDKTESKLRAALLSAKDSLLGHYLNLIEERLSKNKKWYADLEWESYADASRFGKTQRDAFEAEKSLLEQHRIEVHEGILQSWPQ